MKSTGLCHLVPLASRKDDDRTVDSFRKNAAAAKLE